MVTASFRIPESALGKVKNKIGLFASPGKLYRVLVLKWLAGEIEITEEDVKRYGE